MGNCYNSILDDDKVMEHYSYVPFPKDSGLSNSDLVHIDVSNIEDKGMFTLFKSNFLGNTFDAFKYKSTSLEGDEFTTDEKSGINFVDDIGSAMYLIKENLANIKNIKSIDDLYIALHELTHLVLNKDIHSGLREKVFNEMNEIGNFIKNNNKFDVSIVLTNKNGITKTIKLSELSTIGSTDEFSKEEIVTSFLSTLITNDFIKSNKKILAKALSNKEEPIVSLNGKIKGFIFEGSGNKQLLTTMSQFNKLLRENGLYSSNTYIKKLTGYDYAILNSSDEIKSKLFGENKSIDKDTEPISIFNEIDKRINVFKKSTFKLHKGFFDNVGIADLLDLTKSSITLKKALALAKGGKSQMLEFAKDNKEYIQKMINDIDSTDRDEVDNALGHLIVFGFHILNNDIKNIDDILSDSKNTIFSSLRKFDSKLLQNIFSMNKNDIKTYFEKSLTKILNKIELNFNKDIRNSFESLISNAAYGDKKAYNTLVKRINTLLSDSYNDFTIEDSKILSSKLVSLKSFAINADNDYFNNVFKKFNSYYKQDTNNINKIYSLFNSNRNRESMFGENIELNFLENSKNLQITDDPTGIDRDNIVANINVNGKEYYAFIGDKYNTKIGKQEPLVLPFNINEFEKGIYEKNIDGVNVKFNAQNLRLKKDFIDKKISTQFSRNSYIQAKKEIAKDLGYRQWKILRDNNILLTKDEANQLIDKFPHMKDRFIKLPKDNPLVQISGSEWYIDSRISHQLLGTQGVDIKNMYAPIMNERNAKNLAIFTKSILDFIRETSKALLFISPRIQLNNFMTSFSTYVAHANDKGFLFPKYYKQAKSLYTDYKDTFQKLIIVKNQLEYEKDTNILNILEQQEKDLTDKLNNNPLKYAFEHGFTDTLRTTALEINAVEDLTLYQFIKNKFGKNQSNTFKAIMLNENNPLGKKLGDMFEHSELLPKLALYLERREKMANENEALIYTLNSFPTYNNLPLSLAMFDQISPYTKFFLNVPRMAAWAFVTHPKRFTALYATSALLPSLTDNNNQNSWYAENGYIDIDDLNNGESVWLSQAAIDPILHPLEVLSYKPYIWDIPSWAIKTYHNTTGGIEDISKFMLPINIGK